MELELFRTYDARGTNGILSVTLCHTIELPWHGNQRNISCISEGRYEVVKRYTDQRGLHFMLPDVPGRAGILIHPANDAATELRGCIAPVTTLTAPGRGTESRKANEVLKALLLPAFERNEKVYITVKSNEL